MMVAFSQNGITTETKDRFILDAGAIYKNYGTGSEELLGATRGGNSFVIEQDVREIEADGLRGPTKGFRRIIEVRAQLTANLLEMTADNFKLVLAGTEGEAYPDEGAATHQRLSRSREIQDDDYLENIALVGTVSGSEEPIICILKNALADGGLTLATTDRDEATLEVQFTGHFDPADDSNEEPWEIRFPAAS